MMDAALGSQTVGCNATEKRDVMLEIACISDGELASLPRRGVAQHRGAHRPSAAKVRGQGLSRERSVGGRDVIGGVPRP